MLRAGRRRKSTTAVTYGRVHIDERHRRNQLDAQRRTDAQRDSPLLRKQIAELLGEQPVTYAHVDDSGRRGTRQTRRVLTDVEIAERRSCTREYVAKERKRIDADQRIVEQRARDERRRTRRW